MRGTDIILLARHFLERFTRQYGLPPRTLDPDAETLLLGYGWPGNVRELAHVMERAVLLHASQTVQAEHLGLSGGREKASVVVGASGGVHVDFAVGGIVLDEVERQLITEALQSVGWNRTKASQLLGISKETLRYRMEKYQLQGPPLPDEFGPGKVEVREGEPHRAGECKKP